MHKFMKKVIAAGVAAMFFAAAAVPAQAMDPIMPFQDVQGGMTGTAYTVVDSTGAIRSFDVDIVGNMDNGKGSSRMIMARARGPVIEQTGGILQGMSGSPVYINGRLVGAVAAGIKEMTPYTFFITPIEDMVKLWSMPDNKNKTRLKTVNLHKVTEERKKEEAKAKEEDNKKAEQNGNAIFNRVMDVIHEAEDTVSETKKKQQEAAAAEAKAKEDAKAAAADKEKAAENTAASAENETKDVKDAKEAKAESTDEAKAEAKDEAKNAAEEVVSDEAEAEAEAGAAKAAAAAVKPAKTTKEPKAVMYLAGFGQPGMDFLQKHVPLGEDITFLPMGIRSEGEGNTLYNASLQPGSAVGAAIVYGDFAVGATGTVTAVDGKKILAFGHPFLHRGNVNYFMTDAKVVGTISGTSNGMKIATVGNIIGRINQDRETGIAGTIGEFPTVVPIKVRITDNTLGRTDDYGARIAYDEDFLPELSGGIAYAAMTKTSDTLAGSTANVHFTIRTNAADGGKFERSNMFYNTADVGQIAVGELMQAMSIVCSNTEQESDIVDVQVDVQMDNGRKTATLLSAVPDKSTVKPGDLVKFTTTIKPYRRDKETLLIPYRVPQTAAEGPLTLDIRGGGVTPLTTQLKLLQQTGVDLIAQEDKTATTKDKLQNLKRTGRNNEIIIAPGASAAVMTPAQQRKALRAAKKAAEEAQKQRRFSFSLDNKKQENTGETKFTTNYIIDNVIHTTLQVERK